MYDRPLPLPSSPQFILSCSLSVLLCLIFLRFLSDLCCAGRQEWARLTLLLSKKDIVGAWHTKIESLLAVCYNQKLDTKSSPKEIK